MQSCDLSHFLEILELGLSSLLSPLGTVDPCGEDVLSECSTSLSPEDLIFQGHPPYLSSGQASPWELDHPKFLQTPHWDVFWLILGHSA
jgi:hypothetical protein